MSTIEESFRAHLLSLTPVSAVLGQRLYPISLPQNPSYPAGVYHIVSARSQVAHDGPGDLHRKRLQLDLFGLWVDYGVVKGLAKTIRTFIDGTRGQWGDVAVHACFFENETDNYSDQSEIVVVRVDYSITYKE